MKKIVLVSILAMCLPWTLAAQSVDDDLYYIPSKKKKEQVREEKKKAADEVAIVETDAPAKVYADAASTTVVVSDRSKKEVDIDSYNRRYTADEYDFSRQNDTLYIDTRSDDGLDGEWVNGEFSGSADDYEYATRIIRFRNPRYAVSISSPMYWDIVYGLNSWEWNVYTDGLYAYAFPTFSNRYWWDWRYNSFGWGWNSWWGPSWSFSWNWGWGGWYNHYCGPHFHHHHHHYYPGWNHGYWSNSVYTNRRSYGPSFARRNSLGGSSIRNTGTGTPRRSSGVSTSGSTRRSATTINGGQTVRRSSSAANGQQVRRGNASTGTSRRVIGTRTPSNTRPSVSTDRNTTRRTVYTRPSSTRSRVDRNGQIQDVRRSGATRRTDVQSERSTYRRGSSSSVRNSNSNRQSSRSSFNNRSMNGTTRSSSSFSSGGSFRSSGGMSGGGSSRGGSERRR